MKYTFFLFLIVILFACCSSEEEMVTTPEIPSRDILVNAISDVVHPIVSSNPTENFSELEVLDQFASARIIGMGEASHGTKEFFEMKHKMLRYFVEEHGYRGLIMEADFGECLKANEYVLNDIGTIDDVMRQMHFWTWRTEEVKAMIQWMHDYNLGKPLEEKVYYLGSDCQFADDNLNLIEEKISQLPTETASSIKFYSDKLNKTLVEVAEFDRPTMDSMLVYSDSMFLEIVSHKAEIESQFSTYEFNILRQLALITHQSYEVAKAYVFNEDYNYRDLYMAENTLWWANQLGADEKFLVWAHNYHVSKFDIDNQIGSSQGGHLSVELGENYKVIGFSMATGFITAVELQEGVVPGPLPSPIKFGSINELFHLTNKQNFIWVFDAGISEEAPFDWFSSPRDFMGAGARHPSPLNYYRKARLFKEFDAVIHFDVSTATDFIVP